MIRLTHFALRQPAITILLMLILLIAGSAAGFGLNQELVPQVEFPQATVVTIWPGASANEVTESIVKPIEDALEGITNVEVVEITSSASESFAAITVLAEYGVDQDALRDAIEAELADVDLPDDAEDPDVVLFSFSDLPVLQSSVRGNTDALEDSVALQRLIEDKIVPELEAIEGVSQVSLAGGREEKIFVNIDPDKLAAAGLSVASIRNSLSSNDLGFPAGSLSVDGREIPLQVLHRVDSLDALADLSLSEGGGGPPGGGPPSGGGPPASAQNGAAPASDSDAADLNNDAAGSDAGGSDAEASKDSANDTSSSSVASSSSASSSSATSTSAGDAADENSNSSGTTSASDFPLRTVDGQRILALPLPQAAVDLGYATTADLTADAIRTLELIQPRTLRLVSDAVIADLPAGGPSPLTDSVIATLPREVRQALADKLAAEPERDDSAVGATDDSNAGDSASQSDNSGSNTGNGSDAAAGSEGASSDSAADTSTSRSSVTVVRSGDSVESIARRFGVDADDLRSANGLGADDPLVNGSVLRIPAGASDSSLPVVWNVLGITDASEITPDILATALERSPDAVAALTADQILALPAETAIALPLPFVQRQPTELREALLRRAQQAGLLAAAGIAAPPKRISDVAEVVLEAEDPATLNRTDSVPSLSLVVYKEKGANTVSVVNAVLDRIEEIQDEEDFGDDLEFNTIFEQAGFIEESLRGVRNEGILGSLFAILVILVFLSFSVRSTIVVALSIPLSILAALVVMNGQGLTLNMLTLAGLTIAIGRVVDDTIVVLENIYRHIQSGEEVRIAVVEGTREVATAITSATLVAVAVFLPLGLVGGITSEFFMPFALTTSYALLASLIVAVTVVPLLASRLLNKDVLPEERESFLQRIYTPALEWALDHRLLTLALAFIFFLGSLGLIGIIDKTFLPGFGEPAVTVEMALPPGTDLETTDTVAREVEALLMSKSDIDTVETTVGRGGQFFGEISGGNSSNAFFFNSIHPTVDYNPDEDTNAISDLFAEDVDVVALADTIRDDLKALTDDMVDSGLIASTSAVSFTVSGGASGGPEGSGFDLQILSDDESVLHDANAMVIEALDDAGNWKDEGYDKIPLINLKSNLTEARDVLSVDVDPTLATARGLSTIQVALALREVIEGQDLGDVEILRDGETETFEVFARYPGDTIASTDALKDYEIEGSKGLVPLGEVATIQLAPGPVQVTRVGGETAAIISAEITEKDTFGVLDAADKIIADLDLEDEFGEDAVEVGAGVQSSQQREGFNDMLIALPISIIIVYLIMVVTFGSLVYPFTVLFSLPFAVSGALIALAVTGRAISLSSLIGMMMLIGIVISNAIVLVDLVQQYREQGMDARTALIQAGRARLRPIIMTALATIFALIPQAIGLTEGALIASELATTVIGGLFTSTVLTLLVVPVVYSLLDRLTGHGDQPAYDGPLGGPIGPGGGLAVAMPGGGSVPASAVPASPAPVAPVAPMPPATNPNPQAPAPQTPTVSGLSHGYAPPASPASPAPPSVDPANPAGQA